VNVPWPADPLRLAEPEPTVELFDGERLEVQVVPISGYVYEWPADNPPKEAENVPEG
jgi:hypothetical protein